MTPLGARAARFVLFVTLLVCACSLHAQEARFNELSKQAVTLYNQHNYAQAADVENEALRVAEATYGPGDVHIALALANLGSIYEKQNRTADAIPVYQRRLAILEKALSPDSKYIAEALNSLAMTYAKTQRYADAEPLYRRAIAIDEKALGPESPIVAIFLGNLASLYKQQDRYAEAEPLYKRALSTDEKVGTESPEVASALTSLGSLYKEEGRYAEATPLYERSLAIRQKRFGPDNPSVATLLNNLAALYDDEGKYTEAEQLYHRALDIDQKALSPDDPDLAIDFDNLAEFDKELGKFGEAETLQKHALEIREKSLGPEHREVGVSLGHLAGVYKAEGKYSEAEPLYLQAIKITEKAVGPDHRDMATVLNNLAGLYQQQGRLADAEPLLQRAIRIDEKALGPDHPEVASDLNNLAVLYGKEGRFAEMEPLYQRTLAIDEKALGPDHPKVATAWNNLGSLYDIEGKSAESERAYQRALAIEEKALGPDHPDVGGTANNLAVHFDVHGNYAEAEANYQRAMEILFHQFQYTFSYMTEKERLSFLAMVEERFPTYFSFIYRNQDKDPKLSGAMYNLLLWEKGYVATSISDLRRRIEASGDTQAIALMGQLSAKRSEIAALLNSQPTNRDEWRKQIDQLRTEADEIEKSLVARSAVFAENQKLERTTWQQVRDALHPGEAAVEFARFRYFDKGWQNESIYVALVIRPDTTDHPRFIVLGPDKEIEGASRSQIHGVIESRGLTAESSAAVPGVDAYTKIWQPLDAALHGVRRIYLSPDGALNQLPLGITPAPDGKLLMERYDLRLVLSTKDILRHATRPARSSALLVGDPDFALTETQQRTALARLATAGSNRATPPAGDLPAFGTRDSATRTPLPRLPGTGEEVNRIARLMDTHGWKNTTYTRDLALKTAVEAAGSPRVLHLATHGFFQPDQQAGPDAATGNPKLEDPMLRSGLYFAGADRTLSGTPSALPDNGVLTAMEAANLNLSGTELVVLSACNTGQGDVKNGEGVFGLRRALQEAGAQAVLMSLWSVPDEETQELMLRFYTKWLSGIEMHAALKEAQLEMRKKVMQAHNGRDLPYYWGAFVLVGK